MNKALLIGFYFIYLFITLFESTLYDFTGKGFNNEVYFHIEIESLRIAFTQYPIELFGFFILVFCYSWLINFLLKTTTKPIKKPMVFGALVMLCLLTIYSPVGRFASGLYEYNKQYAIIDQSLIQQYIDLNIINSIEITPNQLLKTHAPEPKNLILVYLESFNEGLMLQTQYPDLTPNLNRIADEFQVLTHLSSAYITIEGIISSQCGTMLPMTADNNTFLNSGQLMSHMPCMGDILKQAGYTQYYLGGASMAFAGKGRFLEEHGYDYIWGSEHWFSHGFKRQKGVWGLSDTELFENALSTIKTAAQTPPYNVTLLTLGTHLPGYSYPGCESYAYSDEPFIDAIHCTDQLLGKFIDALKAEKLLDEAILMVLADHGIFQTDKMEALFGDMAKDRRLIALTNYQDFIPKWPLATYDIAPTLLDMLGIQHNAVFLYGQSLLRKLDDSQRYVTRYFDWNGLKLTHNSQGTCDKTDSISWPLNDCFKNQLLKLTSQILEKHSTQETPEALSCDVDLIATKQVSETNQETRILSLNKINHFEHFYLNGYNLNSVRIKSGSFVFESDSNLNIIKHWFFRLDETGMAHQRTLFNNSQSYFLAVSLFNSEDKTNSKAEPNTLSVQLHQNQQVIWTLDNQELNVSNLNLCGSM
ncbi:sulfatase-like hydrolase/transferase [Marinicella litoralis]|nr:sulfatase-like hydrolase/transferase [Marinicella litoralis]